MKINFGEDILVNDDYRATAEGENRLGRVLRRVRIVLNEWSAVADDFRTLVANGDVFEQRVQCVLATRAQDSHPYGLQVADLGGIGRLKPTNRRSCCKKASQGYYNSNNFRRRC